MYKQKFWLDKEQPNLGYADVKLNIACMHPLACLHTLSLPKLYTWLHSWQRTQGSIFVVFPSQIEMHLPAPAPYQRNTLVLVTCCVSSFLAR